MGAKNCPETPRQKLIGMMYLFLTAMLAINVSKDVLNSFIIVNRGMEKANKAYSEQNDFIYRKMSEKKSIDPEKVLPYYNAAVNAKKIADELYLYLHNMKTELIMQCEGIDRVVADTIDLKNIQAKDNYDIPTFFMLGESVDGSQGKAKELKQKLIEFKKNLLGLLKNKDIHFVDKEMVLKSYGNLGIDTDIPQKGNHDEPSEKYWETSKFYHLPLVSAITVISQIQNQVKNAEAIVINKLFNSITSLDYTFDTLEARVYTKSNYILSGDDYEADVFLAAMNRTDQPIILVASSYDSINRRLIPPIDTLPVVNGIGRYRVQNPGIGMKKYASVIRIRSPFGNYKDIPLKMENSYEMSYLVAQPSAVVSPVKMNVLFIGLDNLLKISVPGFSQEDIRVSITNGVLRKKSDSYVAIVNSTGSAKVTVSVITGNGSSRIMGEQNFRIKRVPNPVAKVGGKSEGEISLAQLKLAGGIEAVLEDFYYELSFTVTGFTILHKPANSDFTTTENSNNNKFSERQKTYIINKIRKNDKLFFENIYAQGPDGRRKLNNIYLKVK